MGLPRHHYGQSAVPVIVFVTVCPVLVVYLYVQLPSYSSMMFRSTNSRVLHFKGSQILVTGSQSVQTREVVISTGSRTSKSPEVEAETAGARRFGPLMGGTGQDGVVTTDWPSVHESQNGLLPTKLNQYIQSHSTTPIFALKLQTQRGGPTPSQQWTGGSVGGFWSRSGQ